MRNHCTGYDHLLPHKSDSSQTKINFSILMRFFAVLFFLSFFSLSFTEELRILCWDGYARPAYVKEFQKRIKEKYGVSLQVQVKTVSDPQEFFDAVRGRKSDLISPAHNIPKSYRWPFIKGHIVLPIRLENIPNYQNIIPELQKADYISLNDQVYGVPVVYGPYALMYNTAIIKKAPQSWKIFWDPRFKKRYSLSSDYYEANIYITALANGLSLKPYLSFDNINNNDFKKKLALLAQNAKSFWRGVDTADDLQGLALATGWGFAISELKKRGEIWKIANPKEGTTGWVDNWMIAYSLADKPKLRRFAEEWINFSISPKIQLAYTRDIGQFPVNLSVKKLMTPVEIKKFHLNQSDFFKKNFILWGVLKRREQNGFKNLWNRAKTNRMEN